MKKTNKKIGKKAISGIMISLLVAIALAIIILGSIGKIPDIAKSFKSLFKSYSSPELGENVYFSSQYVGFEENGIKKDLLNDIPTGCERIDGKLACPPGTKISFYVGIRNLGSKISNFKAMPIILWDCEDGTDRCKNQEKFLGTKTCQIRPGETANCETIKEFTFNSKYVYQIHPGAKCIDCEDPNDPLSEDYKSDIFADIEIKDLGGQKAIGGLQTIRR